jgi:outer membrane lipoprotein carrier protein
MAMRAFLAPLAAALLLAAPGAAGERATTGGSGCAEALARRVQSHYESIRDLAADFEQTTRVAALGSGPGGEPARARGRVVFAKPGRMRWSYAEPEPSLVVTDGRSLWTYDPGLGEAQHLAAAEGFLSGAAIQFLLGEGRILEAFRVEAPDCEGERVVLRLEPREPASYERLVLEVEAASGEVLATEVVDLFGNATRVAFANVRANVDPDPGTFRFEPPEGVRVIEVEPAR